MIALNGIGLGNLQWLTRDTLPLRVAGRPDAEGMGGGRIVNVCVVVATGVNIEGQREILDLN